MGVEAYILAHVKEYVKVIDDRHHINIESDTVCDSLDISSASMRLRLSLCTDHCYIGVTGQEFVYWSPKLKLFCPVSRHLVDLRLGARSTYTSLPLS